MQTLIHYLLKMFSKPTHVLPLWHRPVYHGTRCRVIASDWRAWEEAQAMDCDERGSHDCSSDRFF